MSKYSAVNPKNIIFRPQFFHLLLHSNTLPSVLFFPFSYTLPCLLYNSLAVFSHVAITHVATTFFTTHPHTPPFLPPTSSTPPHFPPISVPPLLDDEKASCITIHHTKQHITMLPNAFKLSRWVRIELTKALKNS